MKHPETFESIARGFKLGHEAELVAFHRVICVHEQEALKRSDAERLGYLETLKDRVAGLIKRESAS